MVKCSAGMSTLTRTVGLELLDTKGLDLLFTRSEFVRHQY